METRCGKLSESTATANRERVVVGLVLTERRRRRMGSVWLSGSGMGVRRNQV